MKHFYLGINSSNNRCCVIDVPIRLTKDNVSEVMEYAGYHSTNWGGNDDIERTCEIERYKLTNDILPYSGGNRWTDGDHGHIYGGIFSFDKIVRVTKEQ